MTHFTDSYYYYHSRSSYASSSSSEEGTLSSQFHAAILDQEFLLRAALTHDWDTLTSFCQFLEEIFTLSVVDRRLQWQKNRIQAATQQLLAKDQWGNTVLHVACYNQPPARVVRALLTAASAATPHPLQLHTLVSRDLSTPLLVACATGASKEVIEILLDPPAGLSSGGEMVCMADQTGSTPLTELAVHYELQRKSPMHVHTSRPLDQVQLIRESNYVTSRSNTTTTRITLLDTFQAKLELLFQAAWSHRYPSSMMISMVHGLANVAAYCPPVVTRLVLRGYPHMISFTDRHGVLPLHLTLTANNNGGSVFLERHAYCVQQMLQAYPAAAKVPWRGRSPFVQAIVSGHFWNTTTTAKTKSKTTTQNNNNHKIQKPPITPGPLSLLWRAAPESLAEIDFQTGLRPVQLAAMSFAESTCTDTSQKTITVSQQERILQVDTLYNLIRLNPQVLEQEFAMTVEQ